MPMVRPVEAVTISACFLGLIATSCTQNPAEVCIDASQGLLFGGGMSEAIFCAVAVFLGHECPWMFALGTPVSIGLVSQAKIGAC